MVTVGSESGRAGNTLRGSRGCDSLAGEPRHLLALMPGYKTVAYRHFGDGALGNDSGSNLSVVEGTSWIVELTQMGRRRGT